MTTVLDHLEAFAGEVTRGWQVDAEGGELPFQVVQTKGGPYPGTTTIATLGLSNFPLPSCKGRADSKMIRHELLMIVPAGAVPPNIVGIMQQVGLEAIERGAAFLHGELIGPRGELFPGYEPKALLVESPVYFPEEFWQVSAENVGDVVFAWLIPLLDDEVLCLVNHGVSVLESRLELEDPDLVDCTRGMLKQQAGYA
jgi:hypothetical protein